MLSRVDGLCGVVQTLLWALDGGNPQCTRSLHVSRHFPHLFVLVSMDVYLHFGGLVQRPLQDLSGLAYQQEILAFVGVQNVVGYLLLDHVGDSIHLVRAAVYFLHVQGVDAARVRFGQLGLDVELGVCITLTFLVNIPAKER